MNVDSADKPTPIRPDVEILPPDAPRVIRPGIDVPSSSPRRSFLKRFLGAAGLLALGGTAVASQTETGKKVLAASPLTPHTTNRPSPEKQLQEVEQNLKAQQNSGKGPEGYDAFTLEQMAKIKAQNQAKEEPRPSPTPTSKGT